MDSFSNFKNQKQSVRGYFGQIGFTLSVMLPEHSSVPLSFKMIDGTPMVYILEDVFFADKPKKELKFIFVRTEGEELQNAVKEFGNHMLRYIGSDARKGGSYMDSLRGQVDWYEVYHCFQVVI